MPSQSEVVIVAFGAGGGGETHFEFFKLLKPLPGLTKLLVRDPRGRKSWYNAGLPGVGETPEEVAAAIRREIGRLGAKRIVTLGSSMGGYGAILFGCMLGADRAIALAPQTYLDPVLGKHGPPPELELQAPDLKPLIRAAPTTRIDLVAGWDDPRDIFQAQRVATLPSVRVLALQGGMHGFVEDLHREERLVPLLTELVEGAVPDICEVNPELDPDSSQRIADTAYAMQRRDWDTVAERIAPVADRSPDWAGPNFHLGQALSQMSRWQEAEPYLAKAVGANPRWANAQLTYARCLLKLDQAEPGRSAALRAAEINPALSEAVERLLAAGQ